MAAIESVVMLHTWRGRAEMTHTYLLYNSERGLQYDSEQRQTVWLVQKYDLHCSI